MLCLLGISLCLMQTTDGPGSAERSPVAVNSIAAELRDFRVGPVVSDSGGKGASLIGISYEKTDDGYRPTLVVWELGPQGKKLGEFNHELTIPPRKSPEYPFGPACRWENGDIALITLFRDYQLIRLNRRGEVVHTREPERTARDSESFTALVPGRENGLWLGATFKGQARLYRLDDKGEVLLRKELVFGEYTHLIHLVQPGASSDVLACGVWRPSDGSWEPWIARFSSEGEILKKTMIPGGGQLAAMAALPDQGAAVLQVAGDRDQRTVTIWIFEKDLKLTGSSAWTGPTIEALHFSMAYIGDELLILAQGRWDHHLLRVDAAGQIKARDQIATGIHPFPRMSFAVLGGELLIPGRLKERDGSARMSELQVEAYKTRPTQTR